MPTRILKARLRELGASERGVSLVEFALGLPLVLGAALGGLECANAALAHLRVSQIAQTTADNASRILTTMDETDIEEIFASAEAMGGQLGIRPNGRIVLSSLEQNGETGARAGQQITWQRCYGQLNRAPAYGRQGAGDTNNSLAAGMGPPTRRITAGAATAVMFVEVTYRYQPLVGTNLLGVGDIRYETAFNVRERTEFGITNLQGRTVNSCPA